MSATDPTLRANAIHATVSMLRADKPVFGITSEKDAAKDSDQTAKETGCRPMWRGVYASLGGAFELSRLTDTAGIPFLTLQPKDLGSVVEQKSWSLSATIAGKHDSRLRAVADIVVEYGDLVVIRYAPEMNGNWSPWAADVNGNTPAQYVKAWQHVVTLFREAGATNVLWLWAPNISRGATVRGISQFWPGDSWVDLVGFTGYGVGSSIYGFESSAGQTFDPTMKLLAPYSKKPVVLAETGVAGIYKSQWITSLGPWLRAHPNVIGLIWTGAPPPYSNADWRFNDTPRNLSAFKKSLVPYLACAPGG
ncbi:glycosyl hydrolase [Micromonospora sp. NPDC048999]|uniref:glycoside hydrolase family 26 protein n=1 Tax=Micromonospora sp. NPDC048999 TaxID=3155391 RepID=UPI0033F76E4E